jgi:uncharacterized repeat protein (TIGR03803 family)
MQGKRVFTGLRTRLAVLAVTLFVIGACACMSAQETVLYTFNNKDGSEPLSGLISDASGNLYGTTFYGGANGVGAVFELTPKASGWTETVLYSFNGIGVDGFFANSRLLFDASGNLYGTTFWGGDFGVGIVYQLSPAAGGGWTEKTIHSFDPNGGDGTYPHGGLIMDGLGNLYGTTANGGAAGDGTVYELTPAGDGNWTETVLHSFSGADGANSYAELVLDGWGNLYGTTASGGSSSACFDGCGTVFELSPSAGGGWTEQVLHSFNNTDGANPGQGLIFDKSGNLYGTAGGSTGTGPVFQLTKTANGDWRERILHSFTAAGDASNPSTLIFDAEGNLYGPGATGGAHNQGAIFELRRGAGGQWNEKLLYSFSVANGNGADPAPGLMLDAAGNLYGTTLMGGEPSQCFNGCGIVFKITP